MASSQDSQESQLVIEISSDSDDLSRKFKIVEIPQSGDDEISKSCSCQKTYWSLVWIFGQDEPVIVPTTWTFFCSAIKKYKCWFPSGFPTSEAEDFVKQNKAPDLRDNRWTADRAKRIGAKSSKCAFNDLLISGCVQKKLIHFSFR